jgi:thymidylate synthase (FAD)
MKEEFYVPAPEQILPQSLDNKQGRGGERFADDEERAIIEQFRAEQRRAYANYEGLLEKNVAREVARINLPLSLYTEWYWQVDLHNLFHFLRLRLDTHAQYEIRVYAEALAQCAKAVAPLAYEAFEEHILGAVSLSRAECEAVARLLAGQPVQLEGRPLREFEGKLGRIQAARPADAPDETGIGPG